MREDNATVADVTRRYFTPAEVTAAWLRQGRKCLECSREIPRDLIEGDHIVAWSAGGRTTLDNLQGLCVACNRRKGNRPGPLIQRPAPIVAISTTPLRDWQLEALAVVSTFKEPLLIEACPGSGKTRFALEAAARMIQAGDVNRVLIVAPTVRLVEQWVQAAERPDGSASVPLAPAGWRPTQPLYSRWCGAAFTYQSLFAQTTMFAALAAEPGYRTLVVFDEIHHAGTSSGWGIVAQEAFARSAERIISLSGTPFRTKDPIAFVHTIDGRSVPDYSYSYGAALDDEVCRPVHFVQVGGSTTFVVPSGEEHVVTFADDLNDRGESYRLRTALAADGGHVATMVDIGEDVLYQLRRAGDENAAGLIVCMDCDHADAVAEVLARRVGVRPVVACSRLYNPDDPAPGPAIEAFTDGTDPWIVAVRMVSEGVDIRRLRVIVYATNVVAELGFRQIIGRVVRVDGTNGDRDYGVVVLPADPRLIEIAERIHADSPVRIPAPLVIEDPGTRSTVLIEWEETYGAFAPISSTGDIDIIVDTAGRRAEAALVAAAQRYVAATGSPIPPFELALAASADSDLRSKLLSIVETRTEEKDGGT